MRTSPPQSPAQSKGTSQIFISYRREDSAGHAGRLFDRLAEHFGSRQVFMDIDGIALGEDFAQVIESTVGACEVLVAVIGKQWLTSSEGGVRRLANPADFVRLEVATALKRDIKVFPVLVQGATMPRPRDLPPVLKKLAHINALQLSEGEWKDQVDKLIRAVEGIVGAPEKPVTPAARASPVSKEPKVVRTSWTGLEFQQRMDELAVLNRAKQELKAERRHRAARFYQLLAWWISVVVTVGAAVAAVFLTNWLVTWTVGLFGVVLPEVRSVKLVLVVMGLTWAVVYCVVAIAYYADDPERGAKVFYQRGLFGGWTLIWSDYELGAGLAGSYPLTMIMGWSVARGLAQGATALLHADYSGIVYLVSAVYAIVAVGWYVLVAMDQL